MALLLALIAVLVSSAGAKQPATSWPTQITGVCIEVIDGDSLYLRGFEPQVRLWGVDAPERNQRGYAAAKTALRELALGRTLYCERQAIDKYKRLVARCFITDAMEAQKTLPRPGGEINRLLIERGVASEYCWFSKGFYGHCG